MNFKHQGLLKIYQEQLDRNRRLEMNHRENSLYGSTQSKAGLNLEGLMMSNNSKEEELVKISEVQPENYTLNMKVNIKPQKNFSHNLNIRNNLHNNIKKDILVISEEIIQKKQENNKVFIFL